jgi:hypothetical protein
MIRRTALAAISSVRQTIVAAPGAWPFPLWGGRPRPDPEGAPTPWSPGCVAAASARAWVFLLLAVTLTAQPQRGLLICVSDSAPAAIRSTAKSVLEAVPHHPLLSAFAKDHAPASLCSSEQLVSAPAERRAYNHLVLLGLAGLAGDPMIAAATQREARPEPGGFYVFGFGHFTGDIGYIEGDRNPFLHGAAIAKAPFETEVVAITGSTPAGVRLAADAFLRANLVNGVVAAPGWRHPVPNLLDRDPLAPAFQTPALLRATIGVYHLIGLTQASEDEYRGVLADTGTAPREIWRAKYYRDGAWDGEGEAHAFDQYSFGLHRRAYGNTVWMARFASAAQAAAQAPKIAAAANLKPDGKRWTGKQPPYAGGTNAGETDSAGPLSLWQQDEWVLMSTVPVPP